MMRRNCSKTQGHDKPTPIASQRSPEWLGLRKKYVTPKTIVTKAYTTTMEISDWRTARILLAGAVQHSLAGLGRPRARDGQLRPRRGLRTNGARHARQRYGPAASPTEYGGRQLTLYLKVAIGRASAGPVDSQGRLGPGRTGRPAKFGNRAPGGVGVSSYSEFQDS